MDLVSQSYWDNSYNNISLEAYECNNPIVNEIRKVLTGSKKKYKNVFEIGCFPARFLPVFAEFEIVLNGIDTTNRIYPDLYNHLLKKNYYVGDFYKKDVFDVDLNKKYDIVCSFGFIEHFNDYERVIQTHSLLVNQEGLLIISVPNFSGIFQFFFRIIFDRENLQRHNLMAMKLKKWHELLDRIGFKYEILFEGPIGGLELWVDKYPKNKIFSYLLKSVIRLTKKINAKGVKNSNLYSPYKLLIVKRKF
jgi:2-polyprenyl-3-methyl-5-hydroxy-6-metoxy-1,4-benzoquinol methylase